MNALRLTSCMSEAADAHCQELAGYLAERLAITVRFVNHVSWQERMALLERGEIDLGWICGLVYANRPQFELLAAPVMSARRYRGLPIYFSDVVVRQQSPFRSFADLRGARWAYNEPGSYSGYVLVCHYLARGGRTIDFFESVHESGSHTASLQMVLNGRADAAAIDSTVLDQIFQGNPELGEQIRVLACLGPSPIPPWVLSRKRSTGFTSRLRWVLLGMHQDSTGRHILRQGACSRFVSVGDGDYQSVREIARQVSAAWR